jgi:AcrR family transcriptional regulator
MSAQSTVEATPAPRVRKDVARNRALLLHTADTLIAAQGLDITFHELAAAAGVGVGTVYRHFADKDELLGALVEQRFDAMVEIMLEAESIEDPIEALRAVVVRTCESQFSDRAVFQAMLGQAEQHRHMAKERLLPVITRIVRRAQDSGRIRVDFCDTDLPLMFMMTGKLSHLAGNNRPDIWRRYVNAMFDGFLTDDRDRTGTDVPPAMTQPELEHIIDCKLEL